MDKLIDMNPLVLTDDINRSTIIAPVMHHLKYNSYWAATILFYRIQDALHDATIESDAYLEYLLGTATPVVTAPPIITS